MDVAHTIDAAAKQLAVLSEQLADKAVVRALNRMAALAKTEAIAAIKEQYKINPRYIRAAITVRRANRGLLVSEVSAKGPRIPLIAFAVGQDQTGVTVNIKGQTKVVQGAFIGTMPSGHTGVFRRQEKDGVFNRKNPRLPILQLLSVSLPHAFANPAVIKRVERLISDRFAGLLEHEIDWIMRSEL